MEQMTQPLRRYFDFQGRSRRSEYWLFTLFVVLVQIGASVLMTLTGGGWEVGDTFSSGGSLISMIISGAFALFMLYILIPGLAVSVRRLHDIDRTGWWLLINLIPVIGTLVLFIFAILPGTRGENRFGPDPMPAEGLVA